MQTEIERASMIADMIVVMNVTERNQMKDTRDAKIDREMILLKTEINIKREKIGGEMMIGSEIEKGVWMIETETEDTIIEMGITEGRETIGIVGMGVVAETMTETIGGIVL